MYATIFKETFIYVFFRTIYLLWSVFGSSIIFAISSVSFITMSFTSVEKLSEAIS